MGSSWRAEDAVTPVVGTLLILGMTVVGMAAVLAWGAPTIETIQAQNAQVGMVGELEDLRASSIELSIPDASRIPTVNLPRGTLSLEQGTRIMVTANHDAANPACDFQVNGWADTTVTTLTYTATSCRAISATCPAAAGNACMEVLQVAGSNTISKSITNTVGTGTVTVTAAGTDLSQSNWLFRLTDGDDTDPIVYAEAWLFDSDRIAWFLDTSAGGVGAYYDLGAVFTQDALSTYVEKGPSLQESDAGSDVYSLRVRTLSDTGGTSVISGRGSYQVFLGLVGNYARIDADDVYLLRYHFQGQLGESWCNTMILRNDGLTNGAYVEDATLRCAQASQSAVRSVAFTRTSGCVTPPCAFSLEVIHANMRVTLGL